MTLIVCVDDRLGMMFNHRRQSRDRAVTGRILAMAQEHTLWVTPYSASLFEDAARIDEDCTHKAQGDDLCFVEDGALPLDRADRLILYHWHRTYPADRYFPEDFRQQGFDLVHSEDFTGFSHETITEEVYIRHDRP